jgi:TolB-like protein/Tfp pilus assembly protein PilF
MRIEAGDVTEDATRPLAKRKWTAWALAAALLAMMIVGGFFAIPALFRTGTQTRPLSAYQNRSIVILPFRTESTSDEAIGIGMADALTSKLGNIKALQLISASAGRSVAGEDPEQIRNSVGAAYVFSGNLAADREQMQLTGKLVSTADGEILWSDTVAAPKGDLFSLQAAVAERIWTALGVEPVALELNEVRKPYTSSNEAYQEYLVGRTQMTDRSRENLRRSIATFSLAVSADPDFGLAYVGLADAHALLNLYDIEPPPDAYPKAIRYAEKALQLDDGLAEAHASLAYVKFYYERDRQGAELEFRRAIQLNPSYAQARHWFALALTAMGKPADALSEAEAAQQLDPLSPSIKSATGIVYFMDGRYAEALAQCDDALTIDPTFVPAHKVKRWIYFAMRDLDNARASFDKELAYSNGSRDDAGWKIIDLQMRAQLGQTTSKEIATVAAAKEIISNPFFFAFEVALAFNAVGDTQRALDWIERAEASGNHSFNFLAVDPRVSNLHSEPRFQRLLTKLR